MIYVVILNYNSASETLKLLENLKNISISIKVLVIDNNSHPLEQEKLKEKVPSSHQLILNKKNLGYAGGNNIGIEIALKSNAEYVWILNPDIRVEKDTLRKLLETATKGKKIAAVGPRILRRENPDIIFSDGGEIKFNYKCVVRHKNYEKRVESTTADVNFDVDYIDGSCFLINLEAVQELGSLPEEYFLYFEETDWCVNAKRNGWKLAVNSGAHVFNLNSKKADIYFYYLFRNKMIFARKYHPRPHFVRLYLLFTLAQQFFLHIFQIRRYWYWKNRMKGFLDGQMKTI